MQSLLNLLSSDPAAFAKTALRVIHFVGLVLGLGAATLLDLIIVRFLLTRRIASEHVYVIEFSTKVVTVGLGLLWLSGIGFLVHYGLFDPAKLWNPKIWAKITIVAVLTINGFLVHHFVLPAIRGQVGRRLFDGRSSANKSFLLFSGSVSAISWYIPLLLGAIPQLNFAVSAWVILTGYAVLLIAAAMITQGIVAVLSRDMSRPLFSHRGKAILGRAPVAIGLAIIGGLFVVTSSFLKNANEEQANLSSSLAISAPVEAPVAQVASSMEDGPPVLPLSSTENAGAATESPLAIVSVGKSDQLPVKTPDNQQSFQAGQNAAFRNSQAAVKEPLSNSPGSIRNGFVGLWAVEPKACSLRANAGTDVLTLVGERGARAGESSCTFKTRKQVGPNEWEIGAACTDGTSRWVSNVRLTVAGKRLSWSSQRGTQTYVRCTGDAMFAQLNNP